MPSMTRSNITACLRCRRKKKRCDGRLPRCSLCEVAGAECVSYDAVTKRQVPRSYVHSLEERIAVLELKLQEHGIQDSDLEESLRPTSASMSVSGPQPPAASSSIRPSRELREPYSDANSAGTAGSTLEMVSQLTERGSIDEPAFSKILLTELIRSRSAVQGATKPGQEQEFAVKNPSIDVMSNLDISPVSLPTRDGAQSLVKAYFQFANQSLPLLHEPNLGQKLELLYTMSPTINVDGIHNSMESQMAVFFVCEVFAVALSTLQKHDPSRIPMSLADRYHKTALTALNKAGLPHDVEGVQALLLVAQYSYHHPTVWAVWKTVGAALHMAVELGLHQDLTMIEPDPFILDNMRRTFWVAYAMDRNISMTRRLPLCLSDGAITAKFPSEENDENITPEGINKSEEAVPKPKRVGLHLLRYRRIQSELQTVLYEKPSPSCAPIDLVVWQQQMHHRIQSWYEATPRIETLTQNERRNLQNFEVTYHSALFYLYHPSLNIPYPSEAGLLALTDAATNMIQLYRRFFNQRHLTIYWQAVENVFSAGTALMYAYVDSSTVQERVTLRDLESLVHTCSSVLWGMVEHFPDLKGKRDAFDLVASRTLADLRDSSSDTGRAETSLMHNSMEASEQTAKQKNTESAATVWPPPLSAAYPGGQYQTENMLGLDADRAPNGYLRVPPMMAGVELNGDIPTAPFSIPELDDVSFDWEAFENGTSFATPSWL